MKAAVLSDIHGNAVALSHAIRDIKELGIDSIIVLGDVVMKGPMPEESLTLLRDSGLKILGWIKGNTDMWFDQIPDGFLPSSNRERILYSYYCYAKERLSEEQIAFIRRLPMECSLNIVHSRLLCVHGSPRSADEPMDGSVPEDAIAEAIGGVLEQVILCGHSHVPFLGEVAGKRIFNVGSVGNSLNGDNRISYGILCASDSVLTLENRRVGYPVQEVLDISMQNGFPITCEYKNMLLHGALQAEK